MERSPPSSSDDSFSFSWTALETGASTGGLRGRRVLRCSCCRRTLPGPPRRAPVSAALDEQRAAGLIDARGVSIDASLLERMLGVLREAAESDTELTVSFMGANFLVTPSWAGRPFGRRPLRQGPPSAGHPLLWQSRSVPGQRRLRAATFRGYADFHRATFSGGADSERRPSRVAPTSSGSIFSRRRRLPRGDLCRASPTSPGRLLGRRRLRRDDLLGWPASAATFWATPSF